MNKFLGLTHFRWVLSFWNHSVPPCSLSSAQPHHGAPRRHYGGSAAREGRWQRSHMAEAAALTVRRATRRAPRRAPRRARRLLQLQRTASQATTKIAGQLLS